MARKSEPPEPSRPRGQSAHFSSGDPWKSQESHRTRYPFQRTHRATGMVWQSNITCTSQPRWEPSFVASCVDARAC